MSEQSTIVGKLLNATAVRDAIHFALAPVVADCDLSPGQHVALVSGSTTHVTVHTESKTIGIIDPFLTSPVCKGDRVWLFLYPNTITGLRHEWTHPAFQTVPMDTDEIMVQLADQMEEKGDAKAVELRSMITIKGAKAESEAWLRDYAARMSPYDEGNAYENMMERIEYGRQVFAHGRNLYSLCDLEDADEFFYHLAVVLGRRIDPDTLTYSCSC